MAFSNKEDPQNSRQKEQDNKAILFNSPKYALFRKAHLNNIKKSYI